MFAALAPVFLAASALASPANLKRQDDAPAGCQGMSNGAWNIANFTLVAQYDSDASTQIPLALGGNGSTFTLGTSDSISSPEGTNFTMAASVVTVPVLGNNPTEKIGNAVSDGGFLTFSASTDIATASDGFCELFNTDPNGSPYDYPILAVNHDSDVFSLCNSTTDDQVNVVFNASDASTAGYDFSTCIPVHLLMVQDE